MGSGDTGRFWLCPQCQRHVSTRADVCQCGFDRSEVPIQMRQVSTRDIASVPEERSGSRFSLAWILLAGVIALVVYEKLSRPSTETPLAQPAGPTTRLRTVAEPPREPVQQPFIVIQQQPAPNTGTEIPSVSGQPQAKAAPEPQPVLTIRMPEQQQAPDQAAAEEKSKESYWRLQKIKIEAALSQALTQYNVQRCSDSNAGITVAGGHDYRTDYIAARMNAQAFEENGRVSGAIPGWYRIDWSNYPEVSPRNDANSPMGSGCGK
jgi:hypothetical protein